MARSEDDYPRGNKLSTTDALQPEQVSRCVLTILSRGNIMHQIERAFRWCRKMIEVAVATLVPSFGSTVSGRISFSRLTTTTLRVHGRIQSLNAN